MRLGLIGTGKQGQRYLERRNGGEEIVSTYGSRDPQGVLGWVAAEAIDAVIIANHPCAHHAFGMRCLSLGLPVLIEKPLALNARLAKELLDEADRMHLLLEVAHTHLWANRWRELDRGAEDGVLRARCDIAYYQTPHDYSPWLDWAPHGLALLEDCGAREKTLCFGRVGAPRDAQIKVLLEYESGDTATYWSEPGLEPLPMFNMMEDFRIRAERNLAQRKDKPPYAHMGPHTVWADNLNRRVYRALFAED